MPMFVTALEMLEQAQFAPAQARALVRVLEIEFSRSREDLIKTSDLNLLESRVGTRIAEAATECMRGIAEAKVESMRWTVLMMTGQTALLAGVMYFLLQNSR